MGYEKVEEEEATHLPYAQHGWPTAPVICTPLYAYKPVQKGKSVITSSDLCSEGQHVRMVELQRAFIIEATGTYYEC